ncbi:unnamed protein product [Pedinophyceae sp. YPF-701]|nr:unnamed protein product [Pedinophyceae sp. YPF-701]
MRAAAKSAARVAARASGRAADGAGRSMWWSQQLQRSLAAARRAAGREGASAGAKALGSPGGQKAVEAALARLKVPSTVRAGGAAAVTHVSERGLNAFQRVLGPSSARILARAARGLTVAIPAIGALFVAHLARQDYLRWRTEEKAGEPHVARAFLAAFTLDCADAVAHVVVVAALLHQHMGIGPHVPHLLLEVAEYGGLAAAGAGTLAAVVGEVLAARHRAAVAAQQAAAHAADGTGHGKVA